MGWGPAPAPLVFNYMKGAGAYSIPADANLLFLTPPCTQPNPGLTPPPLQAIVATAKYHSADDAAHRIMPTVGPLCVDPVHEVRVSALQCIDHFIQVCVGV